jgi:8-hydroxy-5-deazaflavin:NADPH oxidoreductase
MTIAIIGTGNVGAALAMAWAGAGHSIKLGVRNTRQFKGQELIRHESIEALNISEAVKAAGVILIAIPPQVVPQLIEQLGDLAGKIIIDATNAIREKPNPFPTAFHAFRQKTKAQIVKCFNTTGFENMKDPSYGDTKLDLFMAGNDREAKHIARALALDAGFAECYDFGGDERVELLEQFALAWINLAIFQGHGRGIGFKLIRRPTADG